MHPRSVLFAGHARLRIPRPLKNQGLSRAACRGLDPTMDEEMERNRTAWDLWADLHFDSPFYETEAFRAGRLTLPAFDREAVGDVTGQRLLHLQCHFGLDTLSWARLGADATGVDFSPRAIALATGLAKACALPATFVEANVLEVRKQVAGVFEKVVTTAGVLPWLADLNQWAEAIVQMLVPGGDFYLREFHPVVQVFTDQEGSAENPRIAYPYFPTGSAVRETQAGSYGAADSPFITTTCEWPHPVAEVLQALIDAGLQIKAMREFPFTTYQAFEFLEQREDGYWYWPMAMKPLPLMYSISASKEGT